MIRSHQSGSNADNKGFTKLSVASPRARGLARAATTEDNVAIVSRWLLAADDQLRLLLLGGSDAVSLRVRVAQSHLRHDMTPSSWSHVAILGRRERAVADTEVIEVPLETRIDLARVPGSNGVESTTLATYASADRYPNVAVVELPLRLSAIRETEKKGDDRKSLLERVEKGRSTLDAVELKLAWLAFVWGVGSAGNPLIGGLGLPSAAFVETLCAAAKFELTPGLASRASCPEAIWQSARWWRSYYEDAAPLERGFRGAARFPTGGYLRRHVLVPDEPDESPAPRSGAPRPRR